MSNKTIEDFSYQWTKYTDNSGHYGSKELFSDMVMPLLDPADLKGKKVVEIGSGTGRIVNMMMAFEPEQVYAVEPSEAFAVCEANTRQHGDKVKVLNVLGDEIPTELEVDYVVSIGVVHHIPEPDPVVRCAHECLKSGGTCLLWLYGKENNGLYLSIVQPIRALLRMLPKKVAELIAWLLTILLQPYLWLVGATKLNLPLAGYLKSVFIPCTLEKQYLITFDQIHPHHAEYYTKAEAEALMKRAGFSQVKSHHRHGYSWTVTGVKE